MIQLRNGQIANIVKSVKDFGAIGTTIQTAFAAYNDVSYPYFR